MSKYKIGVQEVVDVMESQESLDSPQPLAIALLGLLPSKGELLALSPYLKDPESLVQLHCAEEDEKVLDEWFAYCDTIGIDGGALISAITLNATLYLVSDDYQDDGYQEDGLEKVDE